MIRSLPIVRVIAAVVREEEHYLVCRRPPAKRHGGLWEFPGGKIGTGESRFEAVARELKEELQVTALRSGAHLYTARDPGSPFAIEFVEVAISGVPVPVEHSHIRWCNTMEMAYLPFAPADSEFIRNYLNRNKRL
jgi:8-oxo-dGTP diphosphatase